MHVCSSLKLRLRERNIFKRWKDEREGEREKEGEREREREKKREEKRERKRMKERESKQEKHWILIWYKKKHSSNTRKFWC